jgi:hypothetical protein
LPFYIRQDFLDKRTVHYFTTNISLVTELELISSYFSQMKITDPFTFLRTNEDYIATRLTTIFHQRSGIDEFGTDDKAKHTHRTLVLAYLRIIYIMSLYLIMIVLRVPFFDSYGHYLEVSGVLIMTIAASLVIYWLRIDLGSSGKFRGAASTESC